VSQKLELTMVSTRSFSVSSEGAGDKHAAARTPGLVKASPFVLPMRFPEPAATAPCRRAGRATAGVAVVRAANLMGPAMHWATGLANVTMPTGGAAPFLHGTPLAQTIAFMHQYQA